MTIQHHPLYGVAMPKLGWVPAPRYLLRRDRILKIMDTLPAQRLLEIGCGAGALINDLARRGHACEALESSSAARQLAGQVNRNNVDVRIHGKPGADWYGAFDSVLSFEVLEHIEDDRGALRQWAAWIRQGGHLLISVPSHAHRWSPSDVWAGHFRRYEREQLIALLRETGFEPVTFECYGFPLSNIVDPIRGYLHGRKLKAQLRNTGGALDLASNTARSGTERGAETLVYPLQASILGELAMRAAFAIQNLFVNTERGTGYLVLARKS